MQRLGNASQRLQYIILFGAQHFLLSGDGLHPIVDAKKSTQVVEVTHLCRACQQCC